jgi:hypothetical protein
MLHRQSRCDHGNIHFSFVWIMEAFMKKKAKTISWLPKPAEKDYPGAELFLNLLFGPRQASAYVKKLRKAGIAEFQAKDILRAADIAIDKVQAYDWARQHDEIRDGAPLSPLLLVRRDNGGRLIVADGFHRLCAAFSADQDGPVPCKIV